MAFRNFHKLVLSARSNMKMASWDFCVLVFDSSREPAADCGDGFPCVPDGSGSELEVGCATSCDEVPSLKQSPPMDVASSL